MLPIKNRLTKKSDFENVRQNGKFISNKYFSVSYVKTEGELRFGFIVSKKISLKAHERNYIKRTLREIVRLNLNKIKGTFDFVVLAKPGIVHTPHDTIEAELLKIIKNV